MSSKSGIQFLHIGNLAKVAQVPYKHLSCLSPDNVAPIQVSHIESRARVNSCTTHDADRTASIEGKLLTRDESSCLLRPMAREI